MAVDPKQLALQLAVARWRKFPNDPIKEELDEPHEWVREATLMDKFLPKHVRKAGFGWQSVHPLELKAARISTVQQYADFIAAHIKPLVLPQAITFKAATASTKGAGTWSTSKPDERETFMLFADGIDLDESEIAALLEK